MRKLLVRLILLVLILGVGAFFARNLIARKAVEVGFSRYTGFPLEIKAVTLAPGFNRVEVTDLHLMNPADFEEVTFVMMPQFLIDYRLGSMAAMSPHVNEMTINISEIHVVKKTNGVSNVQKLRGIGGGSEKTQTEKSATHYRVDKLKIHVGKVTVIDKQRGRTTEKNLDIDTTFENITDATDITRLVLMTVLTRVDLPDIGVNMGDLTKNLGDVGGLAGQTIKGVTEGLGKAGQDALDIFKKKPADGK